MSLQDAQSEQGRHHPPLGACDLNCLHHEEWEGDDHKIRQDIDCSDPNLHRVLMDACL